MSARPTQPLVMGGMTQNGYHTCGAPLFGADGKKVGYCERYVKNRGKQPPKPHRGPHRIQWYSDPLADLRYALDLEKASRRIERALDRYVAEADHRGRFL